MIVISLYETRKKQHKFDLFYDFGEAGGLVVECRTLDSES